jgi:hypothetical protein
LVSVAVFASAVLVEKSIRVLIIARSAEASRTATAWWSALSPHTVSIKVGDHLVSFVASTAEKISRGRTDRRRFVVVTRFCTAPATLHLLMGR